MVGKLKIIHNCGQCGQSFRHGDAARWISCVTSMQRLHAKMALNATLGKFLPSFMSREMVDSIPTEDGKCFPYGFQANV
jgi:hypothetical protein